VTWGLHEHRGPNTACFLRRGWVTAPGRMPYGRLIVAERRAISTRWPDTDNHNRRRPAKQSPSADRIIQEPSPQLGASGLGRRSTAITCWTVPHSYPGSMSTRCGAHCRG